MTTQFPELPLANSKLVIKKEGIEISLLFLFK